MKLPEVVERFRRDKFQSMRAYYWRARATLAEAVLAVCIGRHDRNLAERIVRLERKLERQRNALASLNAALAERNIERKAMNILVACDGPCNAPYMDDPSQVTEEVVKLAEWNASRLRHWWDRGGMQARAEYLAKYGPKEDIQ